MLINDCAYLWVLRSIKKEMDFCLLGEGGNAQLPSGGIIPGGAMNHFIDQMGCWVSNAQGH